MARNVNPNTTSNSSRIDGMNAVLNSISEEAVTDSIAPEIESNLESFRSLIFLGRKSSTIENEGFTFKIHTITSKERRDIVRRLSAVDDHALYVIPYSLVYGIETINGVKPSELYEMFGGSNLEYDSFDRAAFVIDNLQFQLVERLFREFEDLGSISRKSLNDDSKKK